MTKGPALPHNRDDFRIAIVCALPIEGDMVERIIDRHWDAEGVQIDRARGDSNAYTHGLIGNHNVVLAYPSEIGASAAAAASATIRLSYPNVKIAFLVGVCGTSPIHAETEEEIILGDCIIGTIVKRYDFGRQYPGYFEEKTAIEDVPGRSSATIRSFIHKVKSSFNLEVLTTQLAYHLEALQVKYKPARYPGAQFDRLFEPNYLHVHHTAYDNCKECREEALICTKDCSFLGCEDSHLVERARLSNKSTSQQVYPRLHFGRYGSTNTVLKSGRDRERLVTRHQIVAFEMEGAGTWDYLPTIIVKSACDYADSHKSKEWQPYAAATAACSLKALLAMWNETEESNWSEARGIGAVPARSLPTTGTSEEHYIKAQKQTASPTSLYQIPFLPDRRLVGRQDKLQEIESRLFSRQLSNRRDRLAIYGLGGIGKSRLALELCYEIKAQHPEHSIFWISALSMATLDHDCTKLAKLCSVQTLPQNGKTDIVSLVRDHLSSEQAGKWLLVVDNADDKELLFTGHRSIWRQLPRSTLGLTIFTTRRKDLADSLTAGNLIELRELSVDNAKECVLDYMDKRSLRSPEHIEDLLNELSCLPLAIVQACSYITRHSISIEKYLTLMTRTKKEMMKLFQEGFEDIDIDPIKKNAIAVTWLISFETIQKEEEEAANLLFFLASIENKAIPHAILPCKGSEVDLIHDLGILKSYSFLTEEGDTETYNMHRLVHHSVKDWMMKKGTTNAARQQVLTHLTTIFPTFDWENKDLWRAFMPHAICVVEDSHEIPSASRATLCLKMAKCLGMDRRAAEANRYIMACASWRNEHLSVSDPDRIECNYYLGLTLSLQGKFPEGIRILEDVLRVRQALYGEFNEKILESKCYLGVVHILCGRSEQGICMLEGIKALKTEVLSDTSPIRLTAYHYLACGYQWAGRLKEAIVLAGKTAQMRDTLLADDHPDRLNSRTLLAELYVEDGQLEAVQEMNNQETLATDDFQQSILNIRTAMTLGSTLAEISKGRVLQGIELLERSIVRWRKARTPAHQYCVHIEMQLAKAYRQHGRASDAVKLMEQVSTDTETWEQTDISRLLVEDNLALAYESNGELEKAVRLMERVISKQQSSPNTQPHLSRWQSQLSRMRIEQ